MIGTRIGEVNGAPERIGASRALRIGVAAGCALAWVAAIGAGPAQALVPAQQGSPDIPRGQSANRDASGSQAAGPDEPTAAKRETEAARASAQSQQEGVILVTGRGLARPFSDRAYATSTIDRERLLSAPSGRIEEAMQSVPGFQQFRRSDSRSSNPSAQGATLRALGGNATSRALVLLDGVPMADPFFGYIPFNALDAQTIDTVTVTRGGGSGPFGAGALAGTIELTSAGPDRLDPLLIGVFADQRGETEASGVLARDLGAGFAVASGRWDRGGGFFTAPPEQRVAASARAGFESWSLGLRAAAPIGRDIEMQARTFIMRDDRELRFEGARSTSEAQDASLRLVGRGAWGFEALGYVQARNFSNVVISSTRFVPVLDQRNTPSTGIGGKLELRPPLEEAHLLRLGLDYRRADGELQEEAFSAFSGALRERRRAGGVNSDLGLSAEDSWKLGRLVVNGGLRADRGRIARGFFRALDAAGNLVEESHFPSRSDWSLSWRAGAAYEPTAGLRLRAASYTGLRQPTLNELYRPFVVFPVATRANGALKNERLNGHEAGFDLAPTQAIRFSLTAFDNKVRNAIANVTIGPNLRQRENLPAIKAQGLEAELALRWAGWRIDAGLALVDAEIVGEGDSLALDGKRPPQTPRWSGSLAIGWRAKGGIELSALVRHVGAQFEDDLQTDRLPPATTIGALASIHISQGWQAVLRGENLMGEKVVTRYSSGNIDWGLHRRLWIGLRYRR